MPEMFSSSPRPAKRWPRHRCVDRGDGDLVAVEPRGLNDLIFEDCRVEIGLEQLLDLNGVRARAAQEGRSLKRAGTGADGEVLRVEHNTGEQRLVPRAA